MSGHPEKRNLRRNPNPLPPRRAGRVRSGRTTSAARPANRSAPRHQRRRRGPPARPRPSGPSPPLLHRRRPPPPAPLLPAGGPSSSRPDRIWYGRPPVDFSRLKNSPKSSIILSILLFSRCDNFVHVAPIRAYNMSNCSPHDALHFVQLHHFH